MQTERGTIFDLKKYAIHDGPGIRTTVFFQGCSLHCQWCHNPESQPRQPVLLYRANRCEQCAACVDTCPQHGIQVVVSQGVTPGDGPRTTTDRSQCTVCGSCAAICYYGAREVSGREVTVAELIAEIERDRPFYDQSGGGVTFSGGEPLLQPRFLAVLLQACKQREIHTVVDTSGYARWSVIDDLRQDVDLFLYDLKLIDDARHRQVTGVSNGPILDNLTRLAHAGSSIYVRIPFIPGINDDDDNLLQSGVFLQALPNIQGVELMGYHDIAEAKYAALDQPYALAGTQPPSVEQLAGAAAILSGYGLDVKIS